MDAAFIKCLHGYCHGHQHSEFQELCCPVSEAGGELATKVIPSLRSAWMQTHKIPPGALCLLPSRQVVLAGVREALLTVSLPLLFAAPDSAISEGHV